MNFHDAYKYSDVVISRKFDGIKLHAEYSEEDMIKNNKIQVSGLTDCFDYEGRKRFISKMMMK